MARRNLTTRQTMRYVDSTDNGSRIVVARALQIGPDQWLQPGVDVTDEARTWSTLSTHIKRGYLIVVTSAEPSAAPEPPPPPGDGLAALRELNATASKDVLRTALASAGIEVPDGASRHQMLKLRSDALRVD